MNIIDKHGLLPLKHKIGLSSSGSRPFPIGKYQSLDDVLTSLHVDVIIEPGIITRPIPSALDEAEAFWREEANRRECLIREADDREAAKKYYEDAYENRKIITKEKEVWTTMPGLQVYTGNWVEQNVGKSGRTYDVQHAICLEAQYHPNSVNIPSFPSIVLRPGEKMQEETEYRFR